VAIHVVSVAAVRTLSIKSLEFAASVSVKWRTVVNFQVSQKQAGKNDGAIIFTQAS
jgi:hypothetical protein